MQRFNNTSAHNNLKIKMLGILAGLSAGTGTGLAGIWIFNSIQVLGIGVAIILISIRIGYTFVKCPKCDKSIYKNLISGSPVWMLKIPENCPMCNEKFD
jgi:hypothetical protein